MPTEPYDTSEESPYDTSKGPLTNPRNLDEDTPMVGGGTWRTLINRVAALEKEVALLKRDPTPPPQTLRKHCEKLENMIRATIRGVTRLSEGHSKGNLGLPSDEDWARF